MECRVRQKGNAPTAGKSVAYGNNYFNQFKEKKCFCAKGFYPRGPICSGKCYRSVLPSIHRSECLRRDTDCTAMQKATARPTEVCEYKEVSIYKYVNYWAEVFRDTCIVQWRTPVCRSEDVAWVELCPGAKEEYKKIRSADGQFFVGCVTAALE